MPIVGGGASSVPLPTAGGGGRAALASFPSDGGGGGSPPALSPAAAGGGAAGVGGTSLRLSFFSTASAASFDMIDALGIVIPTFAFVAAAPEVYQIIKTS